MCITARSLSELSSQDFTDLRLLIEREHSARITESLQTRLQAFVDTKQEFPFMNTTLTFTSVEHMKRTLNARQLQFAADMVGDTL